MTNCGAVVAQRQFGMLLLGIFTVIALLLAGIRIYGAVSYSSHNARRRLACGWRWVHEPRMYDIGVEERHATGSQWRWYQLMGAFALTD